MPPISANEIANILAAQAGNMINSNAYAASISQNVSDPFQRMTQAQYTPNLSMYNGSTAVPNAVANLGAKAGMMGGAALGLAADFGFAPRIFSAFSSTMHGASVGLANGGMGGMLAGGAAAFGMQAGLGAVAGMTVQKMLDGVQAQTHLAGAAMAGYGGSGMGMGQMNTSLANQMAHGAFDIHQMGRSSGLSNQINYQSIGGVMTAGMQGGMFRGVNSVNQFNNTLGDLVTQSAQAGSMLHSSLAEGTQVLASLSTNFGVSGNNALNMLGTMGNNVVPSGLSVQRQLGAAQGGAQLFSQMGLGRRRGANYGVNQLTSLGIAQNSNAISDQYVGDQGGLEEVGSNVTRSAMHGLSSLGGQQLIAAAYSDGHLDKSVLHQMRLGMLSREQIRTRAAKVNNNQSLKYAMHKNMSQLQGEFLEEGGAETVLSGLSAYHSNLSGGRKDFTISQSMGGMDSNLESVIKGTGSFGGSTSDDGEMSSGLSSGIGGLRGKILQSASSGMKKGLKYRSIGEAVDAIKDKMTAPIENYMENIGRKIGEEISQGVDDVRKSILGEIEGNSGGSGSLGALSSAGFGKLERASVGGSTYGNGVSGGVGGLLGHIRAGGHDLGADSGFHASGMGMTKTMGAPIGKLAGKAMSGLGGAGMGLFKLSSGLVGPSSGIWGMGGYGMAGGAFQAGRLGMGAAGLALKGLSRLAGPLGVAVSLASLPGDINEGMAHFGFRGTTTGLDGALGEGLQKAHAMGLIGQGTGTDSTYGSASDQERMAGRGYQAIFGATTSAKKVGGDVQQLYMNQEQVISAVGFLANGLPVESLRSDLNMTSSQYSAFTTQVKSQINAAGVDKRMDAEERMRQVAGMLQERGVEGTGDELKRKAYAVLKHSGDTEIAKAFAGIGGKYSSGNTEEMLKKSIGSLKEGFVSVASRRADGKLNKDGDFFESEKDRKFRIGAMIRGHNARGMADEIATLVGGMTEKEQMEIYTNTEARTTFFSNKISPKWGAQYGAMDLVKNIARENLARTHGIQDANHKKELADDKERIREWEGTTGSIEQHIEHTGVNDSDKVSDAIRKLMENPDSEAANDEYRALITKMSPEDAAKVGSMLRKVGAGASSSIVNRIGAQTDANASFRGRHAKDLKSKSMSSRLKVAAGLFGGGEDARAALGMSGNKEHDDGVKEYIKTFGKLPIASRLKLEQAYGNALRDGGQAQPYAVARSVMASGVLSDIMDEDGMSEGDMKKKSIQHAIEVASVAGAGANGGGTTGKDLPIQLKNASSALEAFVKSVKAATMNPKLFGGDGAKQE